MTNTIQASAAPIVRPAGLKGQLVSEIKLIGVVKSKEASGRSPKDIAEGPFSSIRVTTFMTVKFWKSGTTLCS